ncbi:MAG: DUF3737 family protein [Muribaculaceae bacterium]|nr:DUF3737 family protein [Muribaculaceae bacterium]
MKSRITQLLLMLILCAAIPVSAQKIVLQHDGEMTFFEKGDMPLALEKSVANDTIFLPETIIPGNFTVTKDVTIMGCGEKSVINGNVIIAPEDETQWQNVLLDGVRITGDMYSTKPTNGLHLRNSWIDGAYQPDHKDVSRDIKNIMFESCQFNKPVYFLDETKNVTFLNCILSTVKGGISNVVWQPGEVILINCTITSYANSSLHNLCAINSIFYDPNGSQSFDHSDDSVFQNCLILRRGGVNPLGKGHYTDCLFDDDEEFFKDHEFGVFTKEILTEHNCFGNDGTVMGHLGGFGFSLEPSLPFIKEKELKADNGTGELKVHLVIGGIKTEEE